MSLEGCEEMVSKQLKGVRHDQKLLCLWIKPNKNLPLKPEVNVFITIRCVLHSEVKRDSEFFQNIFSPHFSASDTAFSV